MSRPFVEYPVPCARCGKKRPVREMKPVAIGNPLPIVKWCEECRAGTTTEGNDASD